MCSAQRCRAAVGWPASDVGQAFEPDTSRAERGIARAARGRLPAEVHFWSDSFGVSESFGRAFEPDSDTATKPLAGCRASAFESIGDALRRLERLARVARLSRRAAGSRLKSGQEAAPCALNRRAPERERFRESVPILVVSPAGVWYYGG